MRHNGVTIFCPHHGCPLRAAGWKSYPRPGILRVQPLIAWEWEAGSTISLSLYWGNGTIAFARRKIIPHYFAATVWSYILLVWSRNQRHIPGQHFLELSEGIAEMNYRALMRNHPDNLNFHNDIFGAYVRCKNTTVDILAFFWFTSVKTEKFI